MARCHGARPATADPAAACRAGAAFPAKGALSVDGKLLLDHAGTLTGARLKIAATGLGQDIAAAAFEIDWSKGRGQTHLDSIALDTPRGVLRADATITDHLDGLTLAIGNGRLEQSSGAPVFEQMRLTADFDGHSQTATIKDFSIRAAALRLQGAGMLALAGFTPFRPRAS